MILVPCLSKVGNLLRSNDLFSYSLFSEKLLYGPQAISEATYAPINTLFLSWHSLCHRLRPCLWSRSPRGVAEENLPHLQIGWNMVKVLKTQVILFIY